MFIFVKEVL